MRYAQIRSLDISNGEGCGVALFTQGCHFHCHNCFNRETWDFNGGKEWNEETQNKVLELMDKDYIKRITLLGGEPLHDNNLPELLTLVQEIRKRFGNSKKIWIYSGFLFEEIVKDPLRKAIIKNSDVLVDGRFVQELADINYHWAGSTNQRVIDLQKTLAENKIILYK